jgi:type IV secretory pathway TrbD component
MRKELVVFAKALQAVLRFLVAFWLAAFYGLVGDIEGFDRWRQWFEGRRD